MLKEQIERLRFFGIEPIVKNDGVDFPHRGKKGFWMTWQEIILDSKDNEADLYLFMPDDFENIDIDKIKEIHKRMNGPYIYNIINYGKLENWINFKPIDLGEEWQVGFNDCGFFCNRETILKLTNLKEPPPARWNNPNISSGVGQQLSNQCKNYKIPCYVPKKSLAYHGDHDSQMNYEERKKNPLISI